MTTLIMGAGGIGAYYGARLQYAGQKVIFVARGAHLEAMQTRGLRIEHPQFSFGQPVSAVSIQQLQSQHNADEFSQLILTTKGGSTEGIMCELAGWLRDTSLRIVSLQNGVDNETKIEAVIGRPRTIGGLAVRIGGHVTQPGHIKAIGPAQVVIGAWPNAENNPTLHASLDELVSSFSAAGIPTTLTTDIQLELWKKLLINNGVNPLSALTGLDTRSLSNHPLLSRSVYHLMQEAACAARSDNVEVSDNDIDEMFDLIQSFEPIKTSMLVDLEKGRALELDEIAGAVIDRCRRIGESAPITELVTGLLKLQLNQSHRILPDSLDAATETGAASLQPD